MFSLFDTNHDGKITPRELGKVFKRLGYRLDEDDLNELVKEIDYNGIYYLKNSFSNLLFSSPSSVNIWKEWQIGHLGTVQAREERG